MQCSKITAITYLHMSFNRLEVNSFLIKNKKFYKITVALILIAHESKTICALIFLFHEKRFQID